MRKQWGIWATACATALVLSACGGGGGSSGVGVNDEGTPPVAEKPDLPKPQETDSVFKPFLGTWKNYPDRYCTDNWAVVPATEGGSNGSLMAIESVFTDTQFSQTYQIFLDKQCSQLVGTVTLINNHTWQPVAVEGWTGAVRMAITYSEVRSTGGVVVNESEAKAESAAPSDKTILGIKTNKLYMGNLKTVGADGYPTAFRVEPSLYR